ncbi:MAG: tRNA pseudouridine(55) synthase TruB [Chromatiaceae bacterium]|nr:tRNA pseudouridine(55) synthase TruB [Chromatiaceae bacterium]MBP6261378.1 tRNA pseudouridine(55) synthase TruB [Chromatiaceae bacterium]MBP8023841.1 tRNA pseudouridine(55) synthase TruB [Chromatiaceae bacterium]MBP9603388.1 tRNA pseudouridine(55) synthase TruB [Chromatiaceae bacterium]
MGRRRRLGRDIDGILLLDKPLNLTSNEALQRVKRLFQANKAGHTGSLDPLATGLLPVCLGGATKFSTYLLDADKRYRVRVRLGVTTTTADAEGEVLETRPVEGLDEARVRAALDCFRGPIDQLPPMYSAVKHQGERLYKLARQGIEVERQTRTVTIHALELLDLALPELEMDVHCSKGTYVRTLAEDIGAMLGCGGHVIGLRRIGVGPYVQPESRFVTLSEIEAIVMADEEGAFPALDALLLPLESALDHWPAVRLTADAAFYLRQGQAVLVPQAPTEGLVRLYDPSLHFLGVGCILDDGKVQPKRLL